MLKKVTLSERERARARKAELTSSQQKAKTTLIIAALVV